MRALAVRADGDGLDGGLRDGNDAGRGKPMHENAKKRSKSRTTHSGFLWWSPFFSLVTVWVTTCVCVCT